MQELLNVLQQVLQVISGIKLDYSLIITALGFILSIIVGIFPYLYTARDNPFYKKIVGFYFKPIWFWIAFLSPIISSIVLLDFFKICFLLLSLFSGIVIIVRYLKIVKNSSKMIDDFLVKMVEDQSKEELEFCNLYGDVRSVVKKYFNKKENSEIETPSGVIEYRGPMKDPFIMFETASGVFDFDRDNLIVFLEQLKFYLDKHINRSKKNIKIDYYSRVHSNRKIRTISIWIGLGFVENSRYKKIVQNCQENFKEQFRDCFVFGKKVDNFVEFNKMGPFLEKLYAQGDVVSIKESEYSIKGIMNRKQYVAVKTIESLNLLGKELAEGSFVYNEELNRFKLMYLSSVLRRVMDSEHLDEISESIHNLVIYAQQHETSSVVIKELENQLNKGYSVFSLDRIIKTLCKESIVLHLSGHPNICLSILKLIDKIKSDLESMANHNALPPPKDLDKLLEIVIQGRFLIQVAFFFPRNYYDEWALLMFSEPLHIIQDILDRGDWSEVIQFINEASPIFEKEKDFLWVNILFGLSNMCLYNQIEFNKEIKQFKINQKWKPFFTMLVGMINGSKSKSKYGILKNKIVKRN